MNLRGGWGFVRERTLIVRVQILVKIFLCYPLSQFLPDDDEAASMFTVMVDKEITQHEKRRKLQQQVHVVYVFVARTSLHNTGHLAMLEKDFRAHQMCAQLILMRTFYVYF